MNPFDTVSDTQCHRKMSLAVVCCSMVPMVRFVRFINLCLLILGFSGFSVAAESSVTISSLQTVRIGDSSTVPTEMVVAPKLIHYSQPAYTEEALRNRIDGSVTIEAKFYTSGRFEVLRMLKGLGFGLDESALEAIRQWSFAPATRN